MGIPMKLPEQIQSDTWETFTGGLSGAFVCKGIFANQQSFLKITPHTHRFPVKQERDRLQWAKGRVPVTNILAFTETETHQFLVTKAVDGINLLEYEADADTLIRNFAEAILLLHNLPVTECPFTWTIDEQIKFARNQVETNNVNVSLLDTEFRGREFTDLLDEMVNLKPDTLDLVVVHGDPYNENILVNRKTGEVAAFIDIGTLGVADRYTDLAMIYDDIFHTYGELGWQKFLGYYGLKQIDQQKMRFYRLFNEFM